MSSSLHTSVEGCKRSLATRFLLQGGAIGGQRGPCGGDYWCAGRVGGLAQCVGPPRVGVGVRGLGLELSPSCNAQAAAHILACIDAD